MPPPTLNSEEPQYSCRTTTPPLHMLKPRPTIAGRRLNVIVSRETLDRLRVVTVDDTSINTRNTPHAFTAAVPVPHRRP